MWHDGVARPRLQTTKSLFLIFVVDACTCMTRGVRTEYSTSRRVEVYDEWLTDRSREARELSKFSLVRMQR